MVVIDMQKLSTSYIIIYFVCTSLYSYVRTLYVSVCQIDLFGRKLEPGEFDKMSPEEQQDKSDKMMSLIQRWREERRAKELKQK